MAVKMLSKEKSKLANVRYKNLQHTTYSTDDYINKLKEKGLDSKLFPVEEYVNSITPIKHIFYDCGHIYQISPNNALRGRNCGRCYGKGRTTEIYKQDLLEKGITDIIPIEEYKGASVSILHRCINGHEKKMYPSNVLKGHGCKICAFTKSHDEYVKELSKKMPTIKLLDIYNGTHNDKRNTFQCLICGNIWKASASNPLRGKGCPECHNMSSGERIIKFVLEQHDIKYIYEMKYDDLIGVGGGQLSYDFYLPQYNKLIEYQGGQHEFPVEYFGGEDTFERQLIHDQLKKEYAYNHNIDLLEIFEKDKTNIKQIIEKELKLESVTTTGVA